MDFFLFPKEETVRNHLRMSQSDSEISDSDSAPDSDQPFSSS